MTLIRLILLVLLISPFSSFAEVKLVGKVDNQDRDELLAFFRDGARIFTGGYIVGEFEPGLDKYIVSIRNNNGTYIVSMTGRPCERTEFTLLKVCYRNLCHWDLDHTYRCVQNKATSN